MAKYILKFRQPYEYDPGPSADYHELGWQDQQSVFEAENDEQAIKSADDFLAQGAIFFEGTHQREIVFLVRVIKEKER